MSLLLLTCLLACTDRGGKPEPQDTEPQDTEPQGCPDGERLVDGACMDPCEDLEGAWTPVSEPSDPPFPGTLWFSSEIIPDGAPSAFAGLTATGSGQRTMYDRRTGSWVQLEAWLFEARFGTTRTVEIQVNPEFDAAEAEEQAAFYAESIGRIPAFLFTDLDTVWIHAGYEGFGGGNQNLLIHTEMGVEYLEGGLLEEAFLHEGSHTSLDSRLATDPLWLAAQEADGGFVSTYARDNPTREDVAETLGPYLALRFAEDRVDAALLAQVAETVPNRVLYLDCLELDPGLVP